MIGRADLVLVSFPWGSLARGVLGVDDRALAGIGSLLRPGGRLEALVSITERDRLGVGVGAERLHDRAAIRDAWMRHALELRMHRLATAEELAAAWSTWARRLQGSARPVVRLEGIRQA